MNEPGFLWGAATSAHQVEGNNIHNDWWAWEKSGKGERSGTAADSWHRWREDIALAKSLGHTAHRFSLEWSRLEPAPGEWDRRALDHYRQVLLALRAEGLASFVTLHHFTNPLWLARQGGWEKARAVQHFLRYTRQVVTQLGDLVDFWVTLNEPNVYAQQSFWAGRWPPQKKSWGSFLRVSRHLAAAHEVAYQEIHRHLPLARVGVAQNMIAFVPHRPTSRADGRAAALYSQWFNHRFFTATRGTHDFIGVNSYFAAKKRWRPWPPHAATIPPAGPHSDLNWPISPAGLTQVLLEATRYKVPIYVTENGVADAKDTLRADFIRDHLRAVEAAQARGADVRGYLHWSLIDNFEWDLGFAPRFGLVAVDYATQKRTPRRSAYVYKAIIEQAKR